jgi:prepilin-type N-terminal cleavage/methylation domain-containing protein
MFRQLRNQKGLTLVELMVVVAIIAIIAAVAITTFQDIQKKAKLAADQGNVAAMRSGVAIYYGKNNGIFPAAEASVEALITPTPTWQCGTPPTYTPANGKLDFNLTVDDCP